VYYIVFTCNRCVCVWVQGCVCEISTAEIGELAVVGKVGEFCLVSFLNFFQPGLNPLCNMHTHHWLGQGTEPPDRWEATEKEGPYHSVKGPEWSLKGPYW